ncbi:MAG: solute carrier family 23 protein, partial [Pseudomonadota bacterium]
LFSSFPNTTFSQNNGVIRLTGVASRRVGAYTAVMLILIGLVPAVALFVQALPASVVGGATVIMFALVGVSGWLMIGGRDADRRTIAISAAAVLFGPVISSLVPQWDGAPRALATFVASPVSTGAFIAMLLELLIPRFTILEPAT